MADGHLTQSSIIPAAACGLHAALTTGVHGVGASTVASVANITSHAATVALVHKIVARGCLDMAAAAWIGLHPGFEDAVTDNGAGDFDVTLTADGVAATMFARCSVVSESAVVGQSGALHGAGARTLTVKCHTWTGADSNPGGWGAMAVLGNAVAADKTVIIEVLSFA